MTDTVHGAATPVTRVSDAYRWTQLAIGVAGPPDAGFAQQVGAPAMLGVVMSLLSRKVHKAAKARDVHYEFLFMRANGSQLRELGALYDAGALRPVIDTTFPFDQTPEAMAYVEQGRTRAGKVVLTMASPPVNGDLEAE